MSKADDIRALAEEAEKRRRKVQVSNAEALRMAREAEVTKALADDIRPQMLNIEIAMEDAAHEAGRKIEWKWDTKYARDKDYGPKPLHVCLAVQEEIKTRLEKEGFSVSEVYSGHRHGSMNVEGYGGEYDSSFGGLAISW